MGPIASSLPGYEFNTVARDSENFSTVRSLFNEIIKPLYGDQSKALGQIAASQDRVCEVLTDKVTHAVCGVLVYKNFAVSEFEAQGAPNALEIKTLFVVPGQRGHGLGAALMNRVKQVAENSIFKSIVVTVSENVPASVSFFRKGGFTTAQEMADKYIQGVAEYLLVYKNTPCSN